MIHAVKAQQLTQYTGSNGTDIETMLNADANLDATLVSDEDNVLVLHVAVYGGSQMGGREEDVTFNDGDWIGVDQDNWLTVISDTELNDKWIIRES